MSAKECAEFLKFCLDLELFAKLKRLGFYTLVSSLFDMSKILKQTVDIFYHAGSP